MVPAAPPTPGVPFAGYGGWELPHSGRVSDAAGCDVALLVLPLHWGLSSEGYLERGCGGLLRLVTRLAEESLLWPAALLCVPWRKASCPLPSQHEPEALLPAK